MHIFLFNNPIGIFRIIQRIIHFTNAHILARNISTYSFMILCAGGFKYCIHFFNRILFVIGWKLLLWKRYQVQIFRISATFLACNNFAYVAMLSTSVKTFQFV